MEAASNQLKVVWILFSFVIVISTVESTVLQFGGPDTGHTSVRNVYVPYTVNATNLNTSLLFEINASAGNPQIYISTDKSPNNVDFTWNSIAIGPEKFLLLSYSDPLFPSTLPATLYVSISCFLIDTCDWEIKVTEISNDPPNTMESSQESVLNDWYGSCCSGDVCRRGRTACEWLGILCDINGNVNTLQVHGRFMQPNCIIPSSVGIFHAMERLDLNGNSIIGNVPAGMGNMTNLVFLDLSFNYLEGSAFPTTFNQFTRLRMFQIKQNRFTFPALDLGFLGNCPNMTGLYITTNSIHGSLPEEWSQCVLMRLLIVSSNKLSGSIPASYGNMTDLEVFSISRNKMSGPIPSTLQHMKNLSDAYFYANSFSSIQFSLDKWPELRLLYLHGCKLSDSLSSVIGQDTSSLKHLVNLRLESNQLTGPIPDSMCQLMSLSILHLGGNQLNGSIPSCIGGNLTKLSSLQLGNNHLTGSLPSFVSPSLALLHLGSNKFSGLLPKSYSQLASLQILNLESNSLKFPVADALATLGSLKNLASITLSKNSIYGEMWVADSPFIFYNIFKSLTDFSVGSNELSGDLQPELQRLPALSALDLSNNQLSGVIPETWTSLNFRLLRLNGNSGLKSVSGQLPSFLHQNLKINTIVANKPFTCPGVIPSNELASVEIDPSYYGFGNCTCVTDYYGTNGVCHSCLPEHMTCDGHDLPKIERGYFPLPTAAQPSVLVACQPTGFNSTSCNPHGMRPYECAEGYYGRLCSECASTHYREGIACEKCPDNGTVSLALAKIILLVICAILFPVYVFNLSFEPNSESGGKLTSFIGFLQLLSGISSLPLPWPEDLTSATQIAEILNFSIGEGFECYVSNHDHRYYFFLYNYLGLSLPLLFTFYSFAVLGLALLFFRVRGKKFQRKPGIRTRFFFITVYLLELSYFPVVKRVLALLSCENDAVTHIPYSSSMPWLSCDSQFDSSYLGTYIVSVFALFLIVFGVPVLFMVLLARSYAFLATRELWYLIYGRQTDSKQDEKVTTDNVTVLKGALAWFGNFFSPFRKECFAWSMVTLLRKLVLSFALAFVPSTSAWSGILMGVVLLASLLFQIMAHPYRSKRSNRVESTLLTVLLWTFLSGQLLSNGYITVAHSWISISVVIALIYGSFVEVHAMLADFPFFERYFKRIEKFRKSIDFLFFIQMLCAPKKQGNIDVEMSERKL